MKTKVEKFKEGKLARLGTFAPGRGYPGEELRYDLHTRRSLSAEQIVFKSTHAGRRALYTVQMSNMLVAPS
ncbi:MAG: hypothetical protein U5S82_12775 [Gammaproteobacteria bacterium]|nr:hypothetical protein [Gammaproteobacteria bacterium]